MNSEIERQRAISLMADEIVKNQLVVFAGAECSCAAGLGAQNTLLFLGASFEDPRLIEMDDHVIQLFGSFRKTTVII